MTAFCKSKKKSNISLSLLGENFLKTVNNILIIVFELRIDLKLKFRRENIMRCKEKR